MEGTNRDCVDHCDDPDDVLPELQEHWDTLRCLPLPSGEPGRLAGVEARAGDHVFRTPGRECVLFG